MRKVCYSRLEGGGRTIVPRAALKHLGLRPGDMLRYVIKEDGLLIEKAATPLPEDPLATFQEWRSPEDDAAYADL